MNLKLALHESKCIWFKFYLHLFRRDSDGKVRCLLRLSGGRLNSTIAMISEVRGNRRDFKSRTDLEHLVEGGGG